MHPETKQATMDREDLSQNTGNGPTATSRRRVRWRPAHARAITAGAVICLVFILSIALQVSRQGKQTIRLQQVTRRTIATITRRWTTGSGATTSYWVAYRYPELPPLASDQTKKMDRLWWSALSPGARMSIRYVPADPSVDRFMENRSHLYDRWFRTVVPLSVLIMLVPVWVYVAGWRRKRAQFWLVEHGKPVVAEITDLAETMIPRGERSRWHYDLQYCFPGPGGQLFTSHYSETGDSRRTWEIGALVTVFFDPDNPARHALYADLPAEIMSREQ